MASNGDYLLNMPDVLRIKFLAAQSASASSPWRETQEMSTFNFHADAIETGGTIEVMGRNDETTPASSTDGPILVTLAPTSLMGVVTELPRWLKTKKTAGGAPAASTVISEGKR